MGANIIAIDGPGGSGKSTITRLVAARLGLRYLDTGAMYRAATLHCMRSGVTLAEPAGVARALRSLKLEVELVENGPVRVRLNGEDVTALIRTPEVTRNIRHIADVPEVRQWLVDMQREIGKQGDLVTEGRDQGTVVFPQASLKIYLVASPEVRARRRMDELRAQGAQIDQGQVQAEVNERDQADFNRKVGALRKAADAIEIDTSAMTPDEVAEAIVRLAREKLALKTQKIDKTRLGLDSSA